MESTFAQQPDSEKKRSQAAKSSSGITFSPAVELGAVAGVPLFLQQSSVSQSNTSLQPKLTVNEPGDVYEQEADRTATEVMRMPDLPTQQKPLFEEEEAVQTKPIAIASVSSASLQQKCSECEQEQVQRLSNGTAEVGSDIGSRLSSSKGGGSPLSDEVRSFMEPRFSADFSQVRVHTGSEAAQMNRDLNAQAFTHQQDVYFGASKSPAKDALTAHELTHVVQQTGQVQMKPKKSEKSKPLKPYEPPAGSYILAKPPLIPQQGETCWAASLLMWLIAGSAGGGLASLATPEGIVRRYRDKGYLKGSDPFSDTLLPSYWKDVASDYDMGQREDISGSDITYDFLAEKLSKGLYLWVTESLSPYAHAYVVYGVERGDEDVAAWHRADPNKGVTFTEPLTSIQAARIFKIGF
ncbi:DUF4157 domain-containing protein [Leptolyngbyaceae cyanobacterium UHCC 1019]